MTTIHQPRVAAGRLLALAAVSGLVLASLLPLSGCGGGARGGGGSLRPAATWGRQIDLDGQASDWPESAASVADANYLYFRVNLPEEVTLQQSPEPATIMVDLDNSASTGWTPGVPRDAAGYGFDLGVQFSPPDGRGGVAALALDPSGTHTPVPHHAIGLRFSPTHSATQFEVRVSRHAGAEAPPALADLLASGGPATAMVTLQDSAGKTVGWSDPERFSTPRAASSPPRAEVAIPPKPENSIRVVSWNVLKSGPMTNAGPFSRVFQALDADVILVQEWENADAADLQAWFTAVVSGDRSWSARTSAGAGVAIIAPHPVSGIGPGRISTGESESAAPVRWVAGVVQTPIGDVAVASIHLKCCGGAGGPEDQQRMAEAQVINAAMREAYAETTGYIRVIAGDYNLVGSRPPLDALRAGLDVDASDLEPAEAFTLGDAAMDTWADPASQFTPGRLDYAVFSDSTAELVHAFVFDTTRLSDGALARMGLDRADTSASDHKPLVIDLRLK